MKLSVASQATDLHFSQQERIKMGEHKLKFASPKARLDLEQVFWR